MDVTQQKPKFYLTTPIYYPNARPHVGSAYTTIACDAIARYKRMCGYDVVFLTGTDEHGEKLQRAADAAGMEPRDFVAEKRQLFTGLWQKLGMKVCEYPYAESKLEPGVLRFVYTDHPDHQKTVWRMIRRARDYRVTYCAQCDDYVAHGTTPPSCPKCGGVVEQRPAIFSKRYEGRYCIHDEMYVSEGADQIDCPNCGRPTELISEDNYFFRLSAFRKPLLELYERSPKFVQRHYRMNEVKSFVGGELRDISVSRRRIKWGIPWPDDPDQVVYVWYDALTSYLTGIGFAEGENGSAEFQEYWNNGEVVHMIGKDILRFHAVYWPAFLWAANLPLPKTIFAHGWIYYEQDKMSKSKGNVVYPEPIVQAFEEMGAPGNDALRYYLLRDTPFGRDGSFSYEGLVQRYNSDLANDLGNLVNRTITMLNRYFDGRVPERPSESEAEEKLKKDFFDILTTKPGHTDTTTGTITSYRLSFEIYELAAALAGLWALVSRLNEYLVREEPWKMADVRAGEHSPDIARVLYTVADLLRTLAVLLHATIPDSAKRLWAQLGCEGDIEKQTLGSLGWGQLKPGTRVGKPEPIFPRLKKEEILARLHELAEADRAKTAPTKENVSKVENPIQPAVPTEPKAEGTAAGTAPAPSSVALPAPAATDNKITIDDFAKVELRVGQVVSAEAIPGAKKLLKLMVDIGTEVRQVCAGIAEFYEPSQLVGMKIVLVANLAPRKLRGVESNGMVVAASVGENGRPVLATFKEDVPNGTRLK